jgi:ATP synthase protein I
MFWDVLKEQRNGMEAMASSGVIGLHLVSGPIVGFAIGYGIDSWLATGPWGKVAFLFIGIGAGFLNVYRDTRRLLRKMAKEDAASLAGLSGGSDADADRGDDGHRERA